MITSTKTANHIALDKDFIVTYLEEFPEYLRTKENFMKLATFYARIWESMDAEFVKIAYYRLLDNAEGVVLDNIGEMLNVKRISQNDIEYRALIKFRSIRQVSNATRPDIVSLLRIIFYGEFPVIYKGINSFIELIVPKVCFDEATLSQELEDLFPVSTNLWVLEKPQRVNPFIFIDQKFGIQPEGTGGFFNQRLPNTSGGYLSKWIHSSGKTIRI